MCMVVVVFVHGLGSCVDLFIPSGVVQLGVVHANGDHYRVSSKRWAEPKVIGFHPTQATP